jgi:primosomal protein N' (replication factor Y)
VLPEVAAAAVAGRRAPTTAWIGPGPWHEGITGVAAPVLAAGGSVLVVAASVAEAGDLAAGLAGAFGDRVLSAWSGRPAAEVTSAWVAMQHPGRLLVATREAAFWPVAGLSLAFVVEDGRRGLKDKATPTTHARDVLWRRAAVGRWPLVLCGPVPTSEAIGRGAVAVRAGARPWGLVEVVDRTEDPPGSGVIGSRARAALHAVTGAGGRAFVFTDRRSPAVRCVGCRRLRVCPQCGARPGRESVCPRCGTGLGTCASCGGARFEPLGAAMDRVIAEAARILGSGRVGPAGAGYAVEVGTERDLPGLRPVDLAVVVDADGLLRAPNYRAVEDGFRLMARVVAAAGPGRGRRAIVQTADPSHPAVDALRRGEPGSLIAAEIERRAPLGFPPHGELLVIEMEGAPADADRALREAVAGRGSVLGPADRNGRVRWLVQGGDLRPARLAMRGLVQDWRDAGARVRVDADPIDL